MSAVALVECRTCGAEVPDFRFCDQCGAALEPAAVSTAGVDGELCQAALRGQAEAAAAGYLAAGQGAELVRRLSGLAASRPQEVLVFSLALLRLGDYESAYALLKDLPERGEPQHRVRCALRKVLSLRRGGAFFVGQQTYDERFALANEFTGLGLHDEAMGVLNEDVIEIAGREETDAFAVAEHFQAAGKAAVLMERVAGKDRAPGAYVNYAQALHLYGADEAALALLRKAKPLPASGYEVLISVHRGLGTLLQLAPAEIPEEHRILLVQGLLEEGQPEPALAVLQGLPRAQWRSREYGVVLRLLQRLGRHSDVLGLYADLRSAAPLERFPDLHWYFALVCEKAGQFERAKAVLKELMARHGSYRDVAERLRKLEAIPVEESSRVTSVTTIADQASLSRTDIETYIKGLDRKARPGLIAERFVLLKHLGVGGMGVVYKARDLRGDRDVALKRMHAIFAKDPKARERFLDEAKTLSALSHPNIVAIYDVVDAEGVTHLVFECVEGETIMELLVARGAFSPRDCVGVLRQLCAALAHAHGRGVVHRDLKPSNVMLAGGQSVKLMDFGLARRLEPGSARETGAGGTPAYMSPEQYLGAATFQSDLFCLGAMAYEMLTGRLPFSGGDLRRMKESEAYDPLPPEVPARLRDLVARCLKADPAARPSGAAEVERELAAVFATAAAAAAG